MAILSSNTTTEFTQEGVNAFLSQVAIVDCMQIDTILYNIYTHNSMSFIQQTQHWLFQLLFLQYTQHESTKCSLSSLERKPEGARNKPRLPKSGAHSLDRQYNQLKQSV